MALGVSTSVYALYAAANIQAKKIFFCVIDFNRLFSYASSQRNERVDEHNDQSKPFLRIVRSNMAKPTKNAFRANEGQLSSDWSRIGFRRVERQKSEKKSRSLF